MKRIFDVLFSFSMIIITSPILIVTSVLIKIECLNSPVLFQQIRTGKGNQSFKIYKFRSMKSISRNNSPITIGNDSRITKVGKYIRKFEISRGIFEKTQNLYIGKIFRRILYNTHAKMD